MKKVLFLLLALVCGANLFAADIYVTGDITVNTTWIATNRYILGDPGPGNGPDFIKVKGNKTLTIKPGTVVLSEKAALVITQGSKIIANGTKTLPIVFCSAKPVGSRAPQDWGGIVICGKAPINQPGGTALVEGGLTAPDGTYGGTIDADNSGSLKYVRIEFAGIPFLPNNETNGLTLAGVGNKTTLSYIQISYGGDDAYEFFGGTVNANHLVSLATQDDDFDTDNGWSGRVQFGVARRLPTLNDISGSNGFESDNDATGSTNSPMTQGVFSNITILGPTQVGNASAGGNWKNGFLVRRNSRLDIRNSVIVGYPIGANVDNSGNCAFLGGPTADPLSLVLKNNVFAGNALLSPAAGTFCAGLAGNLANVANGNTVLVNAEDAKYVDAYHGTAPNFKLMTTASAKIGADFTDLNTALPLVNNFKFTNTTYRGAFPTTLDWTDTWTNWDPQNTVYFAQSDDRANETAAAAANVTVYPNPTENGVFYVDFTANEDAKAEISLFDFAGRQVLSQKFEATEGFNTATVQANLPTGIYLVRINAGSFNSQARVVVE